MFHELRTYTIKPGGVPEVLRANETVGRNVRGDNYGKLEGYWYTEIGPLNQVMHLWSYDSAAERDRLRGELGQLPAWQNEYVPLIRPLIVKQQLRFLNPAREISAPPDDGNIYEFRCYRLQPGAIGAWVAKMVELMPAREKYSQNICVWSTQAADPNEVCHLWVYKDLDERARARQGSQADPEWAEFAKFGRPMIEEQHSALLMPTNFSPLR